MTNIGETERASRRRFLTSCVGCAATLGGAWGGFGGSSASSPLSGELWAAEKKNVGKGKGEGRVFPNEYSLKLVETRKRGTESYTQGLAFEVDSETGRGVLYESGGRYGRSLLRRIDAETGETLKQIAIPKQYFAEGCAVVGNRLFMLTWRERVCLVYDKRTFKKIDEFRLPGEGWGLAFDGELLAASDGSSKIRFLDPTNFKTKRTIDVRFVDADGKERPVYNLNELEFVDGELWANVYQQKLVVRIDPETGRTIRGIDFSNYVPKNLTSSAEYVLNGLAFDAATRRLYVTGKCWPVVYAFLAEPAESAETTSASKSSGAAKSK